MISVVAARVALALTLAMFAAPAIGAESDQFSEAERRLFIDDHLRGVLGPATLEYVYAKRGSLEGAVDDTARVTIEPSSAQGAPKVKVDYLTDTRKLELSDIDGASANPIILFFLERDIREMHRLTGGSVNYYRKRIRMALAEGGTVENVVVGVGARRIAATEIHIAPYRDDPARARYEKFAGKSYVFTLSDEIPGKVVELRSELLGTDTPGQPPTILIAESLRFAGEH